LISYSDLINRDFPLAWDYVPDDLIPCDCSFLASRKDDKRHLRREAAMKAAHLITHAKNSGMELYGISGYRSYARQEEIYRTRLEEVGADHVNAYIALPGTSEHQSGLALDLSCPDVGFELTEDFALTKEGIWLKKNASLYGFILRYPKNKTKITGYAWEPWHIRYVTKPLALYLSLTGLTLEEFHQF
jgi:D-alanyl-D-alanine carboxypeptidase